jgi:hypothetical protein
MNFLLTIVFLATAKAATYDDDFWAGLDAEEEPFEHAWVDIPDLIGKENVTWYFDMTHHFLTGISRGMYSNDSIVLNKDCFGERYVTKINEFAAMVTSDWTRHWVLECAIIYQLYYMWSDKCTIDSTINDLYNFCFVYGCTASSFWENSKLNILYMNAAVIDAAIVWFEGVPENKQMEKGKWVTLSRQTGETFAEIVKEITNFEVTSEFKGF